MKNGIYTERLVSMFEDMMKESGLNYSRAAAMVIRGGKPMSRQALFKMVKGGSMKVTTLFEVADALGCEIKMEKKA